MNCWPETIALARPLRDVRLTGGAAPPSAEDTREAELAARYRRGLADGEKALTEKLIQQIQVLLQQKSAAFTAQAALLDTVSPLATLARGYAIVRRKKSGKKTEEIISSSVQVQTGDAIEIILHDGRLECEVNRTVTP